jgi:branched-chain amino acid transport system substrate-binding protein
MGGISTLFSENEGRRRIRMKHKIISMCGFMVGILVCLTVIFPCQAVSQEKPIIIGVAVPLTGEGAQYGQSILNSALMMAEKINEKGGVKGRKIELLQLDDRMDPREAGAVASKLVDNPDVLAVLGHFSSTCSLAGCPIYNSRHLVHISPSSTSPALSKCGSYTFRDCITDAVQGKFIADYIVKILGKKKVFVMYELSDAHIASSEHLTKRIKELGGTVVGSEKYMSGDKDFTAIMTKAKAANPDIIYLAAFYQEAAIIIRQGKQVGLNVPYIGSDAVYASKLVDLAKERAEGVMATAFFNPASKSPLVVDYLQRYSKKFPGETPDSYAANAYDAIGIIALAIEKGGFDREKIDQYMRTIGKTNPGYQGATGTTVFDENGDCIKPTIIVQVRKGKWVSMEKQLE